MCKNARKKNGFLLKQFIRESFSVRAHFIGWDDVEIREPRPTYGYFREVFSIFNHIDVHNFFRQGFIFSHAVPLDISRALDRKFVRWILPHFFVPVFPALDRRPVPRTRCVVYVKGVERITSVRIVG